MLLQPCTTIFPSSRDDVRKWHIDVVSRQVQYIIQDLTHWGRVTHICVGNLTIIGQDNGLSPGRRHAIIWTNAGILLIGPLGTNFSEILIAIEAFSFMKMHLKISSAKWRPLCLGLNVLRYMSSGDLYMSSPFFLHRRWIGTHGYKWQRKK